MEKMFYSSPVWLCYEFDFFFNWFHSVDLIGWNKAKTDCKNRWYILVICQEFSFFFFFLFTKMLPHQLLRRLSAADALIRLVRKKRKFTGWSFRFLLFTGRSQWGGAAVLSGWLSLEGAFVCSWERSQCGDSHQVCPLPRPEWAVACPVCPFRA